MSPDYVPNFEHCVLPYVQWYQDDFVGGVRGMRAHEIGIYTMLLMEMYTRGKALDMSEDRLARMCGADRRAFSATLQMLIEDGKIIRLTCGLWNERCENAFRERAKMQERNSLAGKTSAEKRNKINTEIQHPFNERSTSVQPSSEAQNIEKETPNGVSKKRAHRLPEDWIVPPEWIDEAMAEGMTRARALAEAERMKNWSLAGGKNAAKVNWHAAWRNWYRDKLGDTRSNVPVGVRDANGNLTNKFLFARG